MKTASESPNQYLITSEISVQQKELEEYLLKEILSALGLPFLVQRGLLLRLLFKRIVRRFVEKSVAFDQLVAHAGFQYSANQWINHWLSGIEVFGGELVPDRGPVLIAANHPGTYDGLAIASAVARQDFKIMVAGNPFFRSLPNTKRHFIFSTTDTQARFTAARQSIRHLQAGGVLLIFAGGRVEPDPFYFPRQAKNAILRWSDSVEVLLEKVPQTRLMFAINAGFIDPKFLQNPIVSLQPQKEKRQRTAEFLQIIHNVVSGKRANCQPKVVFSSPISYNDYSTDGRDFRSQFIDDANELMDFSLSC